MAAVPVDDHQLRPLSGIPVLSHSALPLQSPYEQAPIYGPSRARNPSRLSSLFSPHHPLRPPGGPEDDDGEEDDGNGPRLGSGWSRGWDWRRSSSSNGAGAGAGAGGRWSRSNSSARQPRPNTRASLRSSRFGTPAAAAATVPQSLPPPPPVAIELASSWLRSPAPDDTADDKSITLTARLREFPGRTGGSPVGPRGGRGRKAVAPRRWWRRRLASPLIMGTCLAAAIALAVGHHLLYRRLDGQAVGTPDQQQRILWQGGALAAAVGLSLRVAVATAYFQYLWGLLSRRALSLRAIDGLLGAAGSPAAALAAAGEIVTGAAAGAALVGLVWLVPLVSLFPPGTLSVGLGMPSATGLGTATTTLSMLAPDLSTAGQAEAALISRVARVAAFAGQIAPAAAPVDQSLPTSFTYEIATYVPRLRCQPADGGLDGDTGKRFSGAVRGIIASRLGLDRSSVKVHRDNMTMTLQSTSSGGAAVLTEGSLFYTALVSTAAGDYVADTSLPGPSGAAAPDGSVIAALVMPGPGPSMLVTCDTYNSSVLARVTVTNSGPAQVTPLDIADVARLNFTEMSCAAGSACPQAAHQAWMRGLASTFAGLWWASSPAASSLQIDASPHETGLLGSSDLQAALQAAMALSGAGRSSVGGVGLGANLTFAAALEQMSLNASLSLMSERSLSKQVLTRIDSDDASFSAGRLVYIYHGRNLLIPYGVGVGLTFFALVFGLYSYARDGSISRGGIAFSTLAGAAQHPWMANLAGLRELDEDEEEAAGGVSNGADFTAVKLRLGRYVDAGGRVIRFGFVPEGQGTEI